MWETVIAPEPIDVIKSTFSISLIIPNWSIRGAAKAHVVIIATVDEPWTVLIEAAIRKTDNKPYIPLKFTIPKDSITPDDLIINPNAPPAPVISNISKEFFREFAIHFKIFLESSFFINAI